jgi:GPH family glycoside/pentoside/hexuronide:cation symporter
MSQTLTKRAKWIYGAGDISFSLTNTILAVYFAIFLTDVVGVPARLAAAAIFIGRTWDYINDPIIGHLSDRTRSRWGRRRPFLLFGVLPFAFSFILLWMRPPWENPLLLVSYYAFVYVLFDASFTLVNMPYVALTPELTEDYDERTSLTSYRMFFSILGSLIAFTIPLAIVGSFTPQNAGKVQSMAVLFGIFCILPVLLVFFNTCERQEYMTAEQPGLRHSLQAALKNRPFIFGAGIYLFTWISVDLLQTALLFFLKYVLRREAQSDLIMASIFVTAIIALPLWEWASRHWNKRLAYIAGIAFWAVVQLVMVSLNPASSLGLLLGLCVLAGIGVSAAHVLPWSIIPDAIEWDEWQTGERHEGMFYSLISLMQKVASSIAIPLILLLLDATGYIPNSIHQPASALTGIRVVVGPVPAVLLWAGILFAWLYPLSRSEHALIVRGLEERRAQKEKLRLESEQRVFSHSEKNNLESP